MLFRSSSLLNTHTRHRPATMCLQRVSTREPAAATEIASPLPDADNYPHISVLLNPILDFFKPIKMRTYVDGTLGAGGHACAVMNSHPVSYLETLHEYPGWLSVVDMRKHPKVVENIPKNTMKTHFITYLFSSFVLHDVQQAIGTVEQGAVVSSTFIQKMSWMVLSISSGCIWPYEFLNSLRCCSFSQVVWFWCLLHTASCIVKCAKFVWNWRHQGDWEKQTMSNLHTRLFAMLYFAGAWNSGWHRCRPNST